MLKRVHQTGASETVPGSRGSSCSCQESARQTTFPLASIPIRQGALHCFCHPPSSVLESRRKERWKPLSQAVPQGMWVLLSSFSVRARPSPSTGKWLELTALSFWHPTPRAPLEAISWRTTIERLPSQLDFRPECGLSILVSI